MRDEQGQALGDARYARELFQTCMFTGYIRTTCGRFMRRSTRAMTSNGFYIERLADVQPAGVLLRHLPEAAAGEDARRTGENSTIA